jgi:hypothetical protein
VHLVVCVFLTGKISRVGSMYRYIRKKYVYVLLPWKNNYYRKEVTKKRNSQDIQSLIRLLYQGCRMVCFQTKNTNFDKLWRALEWKMLVYFMDSWYITWPFGIVVVIWYIFRSFGILCQEKSGNPVLYCSKIL